MCAVHTGETWLYTQQGHVAGRPTAAAGVKIRCGAPLSTVCAAKHLRIHQNTNMRVNGCYGEVIYRPQAQAMLGTYCMGIHTNALNTNIFPVRENYPVGRRFFPITLISSTKGLSPARPGFVLAQTRPFKPWRQEALRGVPVLSRLSSDGDVATTALQTNAAFNTTVC